MRMTIPSRPAPPPPTRQQPQQHQRQPTSQQSHDMGGLDASQSIIKLPPPPTSNTSVKLSHTKSSRTSTSFPTSNEDSISIPSSITRKFPPAKTRYASIQNSINEDPFEIVSNERKKVPPPRPPPPKKDLNHGALDTVLRKPGPPQSVSMLTNIFGKKKNNNKSLSKQQHQFPPNIYPPLSSNALKKSNQTFQSRPYAFVPPLIRNNNETELISFDSPPNSPIFMKKSNSDCVSVGSFSSNSNFSSPNNESISQSAESGFEDDFISPPDPWETLISSSFAKDSNNSQLITSQPVRNLNAINNLKGDDFLSNGKSLLPPPSTLAMPTIIKPKPQAPKKNQAPKPPSALTNEMDENELNLYELNSPPMPNCPPPPPPPQEVLNTSNEVVEWISSDDIDPTQSSYGIALYTFEGIEEGDLSFKENEKVYILQKLNDNWYFGRNKRGCEGIFPSNYIEVKVPLSGNDVTTSACSSASIIKASSNDGGSGYKARSLYNFVAEVPEDMSLNENDIVTVLWQINNDWLYGEIDNRRGQFPANFVEFI